MLNCLIYKANFSYNCYLLEENQIECLCHFLDIISSLGTSIIEFVFPLIVHKSISTGKMSNTDKNCSCYFLNKSFSITISN